MSVESYQATIGVPTAPPPAPQPAPSPDVKQALSVLASAGTHAAVSGIAGLARWVTAHVGTMGLVFLVLLVDAGKLPNPVTLIDRPHPVIPGPPPAPAPSPTPTPSPSLVTDRLRVLILSDPDDGATRGQLGVIDSTALRAYLSAKCMPEKDNAEGLASPAWRKWGSKEDVTLASANWQKAFAAATAEPTKPPKLVIFRDTEILKAVPLPNGEDEALSLLRQYGGN